ncbi:BREX-2 system phosphatase PglZ [Streptomyces yerevanensis]|uniref:BREX-2 system phosphatase PglZ n=1 Tax=Streptomyces yerevanensis TaxID=66378 RepID=UPI00052703F3|nr:BREX-2 system phosphatase PglZ [Streptomyces yerevanensis]
MAATLPPVGRRTVEALLAAYAKGLKDHRLVLVHGRYADNAPPEFSVKVGEETRRVRVSHQSSVLGIVGEWAEHQEKTADADLLVVTTGVDDDQLGWDLRGHAVKRQTLTVDNAEIVMQRFGATSLDPRMYAREEAWLLEALLEAEPGQGWERGRAVLTRDAAVRALVVARLGLGGDGNGGTAGQDVAVDADTLLAWSRTPAGPLRFAELQQTERTEMKKWLGETAGQAVPVLLSLVEAGHGHDAMALGLLGAALRDPAASPDTVLALGGLFGQVMPRRGELQAFTEAVEGTLIRWIGEAHGNPAARQRVFAVLDRADKLAADTGLTSGLVSNRFLPSSFTAQLRHVTAAARQSPEAAQAALEELNAHALVKLYADRHRAAATAVRIARWLALPDPRVPSVAAGVRTQLADWGWVDRALAVLWAGDPRGDQGVAQDFRVLYELAQARRERLDEEFAGRLAAWTENATAQFPGGCLVVENVLPEAVKPVAATGAAPLVLVLDGMSSAVAVQLGEEVEREGWTEAVPRPSEGQALRRMAAVSMLPSVTDVSRASLLTASATKGGQSTESSGFAAFWKTQRREGVLFHKAGIGGDAGRYLSEHVVAALATDAVIGVVLNTIDDALDKGQQGQRTRWSVDDITYLRELLTAAKGYGRPVVLVADHGHVLERGTSDGPTNGGGAAAARWRTGTSRDGEVQLAGPRVWEGGGTIVAPWREDIRYTGRRAGYHGGASLAEVTVPVLVLLPDKAMMPKGWEVLPREQATPAWWQASVLEPVAEQTGTAVEERQKQAVRPRSGTRRTRAEGEGLFAEADLGVPSGGKAAVPDTPATLGARVVASEVYEAQKEYVRKAPEANVVAAVIDALTEAGETMSPAALASAVSATGRVRRNIDGFIATLQRLLNVEGYPVLGFIDAGHTVRLDVKLLRDQFFPKESK